MTGTLKKMLEDMRRGVTDFTKDGECSSCGQCCSNFLPVSSKEVKEIKRYVKKHKITEQKHNFPATNEIVDFTCPFRSEKERKCLIYEVRPLICMDFRCDKMKKEIQRNKDLMHKRYFVYDMRDTFFRER